jgi:hypothetical protein
VRLVYAVSRKSIVLLVYAANLWARKSVPRKSTGAGAALFLCSFGTTNYYMFFLETCFFDLFFVFGSAHTVVGRRCLRLSQDARTVFLPLCAHLCACMCVYSGTVYRSASEWRCCASRVQTLAEERHQLSSFRVYSTARASGEPLCLSASLSICFTNSLSMMPTKLSCCLPIKPLQSRLPSSQPLCLSSCSCL